MSTLRIAERAKSTHRQLPGRNPNQLSASKGAHFRLLQQNLLLSTFFPANFNLFMFIFKHFSFCSEQFLVSVFSESIIYNKFSIKLFFPFRARLVSAQPEIANNFRLYEKKFVQSALYVYSIPRRFFSRRYASGLRILPILLELKWV